MDFVVDTKSNDVAWAKNCRKGAVLPIENRNDDLQTRGCLRSFAIVLANDASEFGAAADLAFGFRRKVFVEYRVVAANPSMGSMLVVMLEPRSYDVVQLVFAEAHEVIQTFAFQRPDETFTKCVRHWGAWRNLDRPHFGILPERIEDIRILPVTVPNEKLGFDVFVIHPHRGVSSLLHYPGCIRMIRTRTAQHFSTS